MLSTITWNTTAYPNGGDWDNAKSWNGGAVPGPNDTASIAGLTGSGTVYLDSDAADSVDSLITDSTTTLEVINGSLSLGVASSSTLGGPVIVSQGASFNVGAGARVTLGAGQTFTDGGTLGFATGDSVALNGTTGGFGGGPGPALIAVATNGSGTLNASGTNFTTNGVGNISVGAGGHLTAANSSFNLSSLSISDTSIFGSGDLTDDTFNVPIFVPYSDVQYLSNNVSFEQIEINADTISSGTLALNSIGTNTTNLSYVFPNGFTVASGGTLAVGINVPVLIPAAQTITDDGTLSFANGDSVDHGHHRRLRRQELRSGRSLSPPTAREPSTPVAPTSPPTASAPPASRSTRAATSPRQTAASTSAPFPLATPAFSAAET